MAEQDEHSLKRRTMLKRPLGVLWPTHKAVQECRDKHDEILQALDALGEPGKPTPVQERLCRNHLLTHVDNSAESVNTSGMLDGLWRRKPSLSVVWPPEWEKLVLTVDSGASDTVVPPSVCSLAPLHMTNKVGVEHQVANGAVIDNVRKREFG